MTSKVKSLKQEQYKSQEGNEYVFQQPKNSVTLRILDAVGSAKGDVNMEQSFPLLFEHVVVSPQNIDIDEDISFTELVEVGTAAFRFLNIK